MKSFTKTVSLVMALCLVLSACASSAPAASSNTPVSSSEPSSATETPASSEVPSAEEPITVRLAGMKGPTTMGMVKLLSDSEAGNTKNDYDFFLAGSADEITPKLIQGELDLAAVPVNLASVLYNKTEGKIDLLAVNTLGVLYLADTTGEVTSVADLKGKTIYATGKGSTPEYTLRHLLKENGVDPDNDVTLEFKSEPTEVVAILKQGGGVAMLPQPFATVAKTQVEGLEIVLDLTREWEALDAGSSLITGVLVGRSEFVENNPDVVDAFLEEYAASTAYANENVAETAVLVENYGIVKAAIAEKALPACNIVCIKGEEMKTGVSGYLEVLFGQNPKAVGGTLPGDDFYYIP